MLAEAMIRHANEWEEKPCPIRLDELLKAAPSMMLRRLSGAARSREFVDGSFVGVWPFALVMRVCARDLRARLLAEETLLAAEKYFLHAGLPQLGAGRRAIAIRRTGQAALLSAHEDGTEDYQALFALTYKEDWDG